MNVRKAGYESVTLLSQYIGERKPDAHVKGSAGFNLIAFICNKFSANIDAVSLFNTILQMYRIFYLDKAFYLSDSLVANVENIKNVKIDDINDLCFVLRNWIEDDDAGDICIYGKSPDEMLNYIKDFYKYIKAAGGLVKNKKDEYLFIKRFGMWDLPKGKMEKGENCKQSAIREVEEETGISVLKIIKRLNDSWHIYPWKNDMVIKKTCWFLMYSDYDNKLIPQLSEDITDVKWLPVEDAKKALNNSYRSLKENISIP
jgi:8-oxo-dGTP pyrophosphatase MutT (NUDIX family)